MRFFLKKVWSPKLRGQRSKKHRAGGKMNFGLTVGSLTANLVGWKISYGCSKRIRISWNGKKEIVLLIRYSGMVCYSRTRNGSLPLGSSHVNKSMAYRELNNTNLAGPFIEKKKNRKWFCPFELYLRKWVYFTSIPFSVVSPSLFLRVNARGGTKEDTFSIFFKW